MPLTSERKMVTLIDIHRSFVVDVWSMEPWLAGTRTVIVVVGALSFAEGRCK